jgi:hypothetical protein
MMNDAKINGAQDGQEMRLLSAEEIEAVAGGRFKIPGQPPIEVYYDDGITIWTSDPSRSNFIPQIS